MDPHKATSESTRANYSKKSRFADGSSKSDPAQAELNATGFDVSLSADTSQQLTKEDEIWWLLARLKLILTRLQDRLISRNVIANDTSTIKQIREKVENKKGSQKVNNSMRVPVQLFSTVAKGKSASLLPKPEIEDNFSEENLKDWNQVSGFCRNLEQVVKQGRQILSSGKDGTSCDRLAEYSFRAGLFVAQMILSEVRSIGDVIRSIDELLSQYRAEISRDVPASNSSSLTSNTLRNTPLTFKDLILQETEFLSTLSGLTSNRVSSSSKV